MTSITPVKSLVAKAKSETNAVSPQQAFDKQQAGTAVLIDIRDIRELEREGRIDGAFHAPRGMLEFWVDPESPYFKDIFGTDKRFVLHCASGWRSALSAATLQDMGFEAAHIDSGFTGWVAEGGAVEHADTPKT